MGFFVTNHFVEEVVFSHFVAALVIGMYAEIIALIRKVTPSVYIICAVIPLVPGYLVYETMSSAIHKQTQTMINKGLETLLIAGALSVGIAVSASLARLLFKRNKRIEAGE